MSEIGTLNEGSLHATLKAHYSQPGDEFEVPLGRFVIDIKRGNKLIEVQTVSFASMGKKLDHVLSEYQVLLVHPVAVATYLERPERRPRKSPKTGSVFSVFQELVSVPTLIDHPNLSIDVVLVTVTKTQVEDETMRRGRGGFRTVNRSLREIHETHHFSTPRDLLELASADHLPAQFTTADMADAAGVSRAIAQQMAYCFRPLGLITQVGRTKAGIQYELT